MRRRKTSISGRECGLRVDDVVGGDDFDASLLPLGNHEVAAFWDDGLRGVADELNGGRVAL